MPQSLQGTEVDGEVQFEAQGNPQVTRALCHPFDYFLAAGGEEPDPIIVARVHAAISAAVPEPASSQARDVFARYLDWRKRADMQGAEGGQLGGEAARPASEPSAIFQRFGAGGHLG